MLKKNSLKIEYFKEIAKFGIKNSFLNLLIIQKRLHSYYINKEDCYFFMEINNIWK